jgi:hypothetical protein
MTRVLPHTAFNRSKLTHLLADLARVDYGAESKQSVAERLGQWLDVADSITLFSALGPTGAPPSGALKRPTAARVAEEFSLVRAALMMSIRNGGLPGNSEGGIKFPLPRDGASAEIAASYGAFHRYYVAHQRDMELRIGSLRANVRQALSQATPALGQLVTLDAALEKVLTDRERRLLSLVPGLLEKRFEALLKAHQQTLIDCNQSGQADDPTSWLRPGGWLAVFRDDLHRVLLAELELRLQPVAGLVEAFGNEVIECS